MANRIRLFHLQFLLIVVLSNGGPFFGVDGLSLKDPKKYFGTGHQDLEPWEGDYDGPVDNAGIQPSLEYFVDLIELLVPSLNMQSSPMKRSDCCSADHPNTCVLDPYRPYKCVRGVDVNPPPIEPTTVKSKLREIMFPHPVIPGPTKIYQYGSFSENDFPNMFDPYFDDNNIPVNPPPINPTDEWDSEPIFPKFDPQSPPLPPNNPWPPIIFDNLPAHSRPRYFRNELQAKSDPPERAQAFFWPWNQNRPKPKPKSRYQPRGVKQLAFDAQYVKDPNGYVDNSGDEWLNLPLPDKEYNDVTLVLPGGVLSKGPKSVRSRKTSNRS